MSLNGLISLSGKKLIVPFYHIVSNEPCEHIRHLYYYKNTTQFEADLDYLLRYFQPLSIEEVFKNEIRKPSFLLTFDDGLREMESIVMPLLLRKGIPAVFFVNPPFIDNRDLMFRYKISLLAEKIKSTPNADPTIISRLLTFKQDHPLIAEWVDKMEVDVDGFLKKRKPYMDRSQLHTLHKNGFAIGSHSMTHTHFAKINEAEQYDEIRLSQAAVNEWFSPAVKAFAFPFEDIGVKKSLFEKMYADGLADMSFGSSAMKTEAGCNRHFHRIDMEKNEPSSVSLYRYFIKFILQKVVSRDKIYRQ